MTIQEFKKHNKNIQSFPSWVYDNLKTKRNKNIKLGFGILNRLDSPAIPENCMYKMYTEEMVKYFMNLTD